MHDTHDEHKHTMLPYGTYVTVWLALVALTGTTVTATALHLGDYSVHAAILIALVKGTLVVSYFMNMKQEPLMFRVMLGVALATLTTILVLTFADISFR